MEHLVLGLVLLAGTLAAGNPLNLPDMEEVVLDMAPTSFDDQYEGCEQKMERELVELNHTELYRSGIYKKIWKHAAAKWQKQESRVPKPPGLRTEHAVALMAYTHDCLYPEFNAAVREAGRSCREYMDHFHFKTLHFLLTQALKILREAQPRKCYHVYRGVRNIRFTARLNDSVRFGHFASSSLNKTVAMSIFGQDTFFIVNTCYGVPIWNFSFYPGEEEVLIPPFEKFRVTNITYDGKKTHIQLNSTGIFSCHNCKWLQGKGCKDQPCNFSAGRTIIGDPWLLWGLLLAATALAATGGP